MKGVRFVHQVSLSIAGILALGLVVVPAFVPQELRADAASRFAGLAQYFDTMLSDAWRSAFTEQGSDHRAGVSASHSGSGSHSGAMPVLTGGEAHPSAAARSRNSDGTVSVTDVKPDAHQDRVTGLGNYIVSANNDAGASGEQVAAIEFLSSKGSPAGSAASRSGNSAGTVRVTDVKTD